MPFVCRTEALGSAFRSLRHLTLPLRMRGRSGWLGSELLEAGSLFEEEREVVVHVIDVVLDGTTHRQDPAAVVRAESVERLVRQGPQHAGELAAPSSNSVGASSSDCSCDASRRTYAVSSA